MRDYSSICCANPSPIPSKFVCIWSEIVDDYNELCKRYSKVTTKCQHTRLETLAKPKYSDKKYEDKCFCPNAHSRVKIIDNTDQMTYTRTEQLALPKPRKISELKQHKSFENFSDDRKSDVNRTLRKSLLSVYSRLMNVKHNQVDFNRKTMDQNKQNNLMKNLEKLSTPKRDYSLVKTRKSRDNDRVPTMKTIRKLSKPKSYSKCEPYQWVLTDAIKHYRATERLLKMSKPKTDFGINPLKARPLDSTYKATERIKKLAEPRRNKFMTSEKIEYPFQTNPMALKVVASNRIIQLAAARDYIDVHTRPNPYHISSRALKAKSSPRIRKLAEPKIRID